MRRLICAAAIAVACGLGGALRAQTPASTAGQLIDWITDGGDNQRTGWNKDEKILTKDNVKNLKLLWKLQTDNYPRALHSLMPVLVVGQLSTANGPKQVGFVAGISDNLYAFDVETGKILWQKHWTYEEPAPPAGFGGGGRRGQQPSDPRHLGFLRPGGSSDTPVIGPPDAQGRRAIYFVTGDGMLHILNAADGTDLQPPFMFHIGKGWALNLVGNTLWMADTYAGISIAAVKLDDPQHKVMTYNAGSGGAWGRRGAVIDSQGNAYSTTGDGVYDPASDPPRYGNSVIGVKVEGGDLKLNDYYTPKNWEWLRKRDLDPNNTPTIFTYKGRELMAASGKECRVYLLDPKSLGGADHQTPMFKTDLFCNEEVDFQDAGSWGALSTWEDASATRWVLAPFWGPVHSQFKAPLMNSPAPKEGGVAAFKLEEKNGALQLTPAWVSRDMHRGEPVVVVNGVVFGYGSGEYTGQSFPDVGLQFDSTIRASKGTRAVIYALDAQTGQELWSSGDQMHQWNHFSGITVVNGRVYLGTYDGTLYCFGVTP
ncbi:MAG: pyrrolo-quinoline quinone [Acidobacteria bacterium]|nr:MAG: pyrrolo-quinoline quinone [Acidobacteriota bacterium]